MTTWQLLRSAWEWNGLAVLGYIIAGCTVAVAFGLASARSSSRQRIFLAAAILLAVLAFFSPIAVLGDRYLLSAHMLQHFILVMIVPPLLLGGIPSPLPSGTHWTRGFQPRSFAHPALCWAVGIAAMILWHVPRIYETAMQHPVLHLLEQVSFIATALLFWWPVFNPRRSARLHPVVAVVYLATACIACTAIGVAITFAKTQLYPMYSGPGDPPGVLSLIRDGWGITPRIDQQLGGLLMWVPGCLVYLTAMLVRLVSWLATSDSGPVAETASLSEGAVTSPAR